MGRSASGIATGSLWSQEERQSHINVLEMMAGTFAVKSFAKGKKNLRVHLKMDNTTAVAYVNHLGGTRSSLLVQKTKDLWTWCLDREIILSAEFLPGVRNCTADYQSRLVATSAEWRLDPNVFMQLV